MVPNMDSSFERILGGKKRKRTNEEAPTFSFNINLVPYSEDVFAEYNWKELVDKCQDADKDHLDINTPLKPKMIIKSQVTPTPKKKKRRKKHDAELEYDIDDPFIDDGEQTDEEIPEELTTAKGGFYINTGNLILIQKPVKIFDEDTEEMMDQLDKLDEKDNSETEPEENYDRNQASQVDEVTLTSKPETSSQHKSPAKVKVKKAFVKINKVKSLTKVKKIKKVGGDPLSSSTPLVKKKMKKKIKKKPAVTETDTTQISKSDSKISPVKKVVTTPKKASTPQKLKTTPKKDNNPTTPKKHITPKKEPEAKKTVLKRKKIQPNQLPDTTAYDEKVASFVFKVEDSWKCNVCGYENETKTGVSSHAEQHVEGVELGCVLCDKKFKMKKNLKQHVLKDHIVAEKLTKQRKKILPSQMPDTTAYDERVGNCLSKTESGWKCNVCNYENETKTNVSNHAEQHIENITLPCIICDKTFNKKLNLKQHVLKYHAITETIEVKVKTKTKKVQKVVSPKKKVTKVVKKVGKEAKAKIKEVKKDKESKVVKKKQTGAETKQKKGKENCDSKAQQNKENKPQKVKKEKKLLQANSNVNPGVVSTPVITLN